MNFISGNRSSIMNGVGRRASPLSSKKKGDPAWKKKRPDKENAYKSNRAEGQPSPKKPRFELQQKSTTPTPTRIDYGKLIKSARQQAGFDFCLLFFIFGMY
jgi:ribosome-binding protein aMBF1 (putative translation factor)